MTKRKDPDLSCAYCYRRFTKEPGGRLKFCSTDCAKARQREQIERWKEKRREGMYGKEKICEVCGETFKPRHRLHRYCSEECATVGLELAVQRQKDRRAKDRATKVTAGLRSPDPYPAIL